MNAAVQELGAFVAALRFERLDASLAAKARDHLLDTIGVACCGSTEPTVRVLAQVVAGWGGAARASVIGSALRLPAPKAAFLNAVAARIHTFDDTCEAGPIHPGSAVIAAALAAAEQARAAGSTLGAAIVAGYEVAMRVSRALGPGHYGAGFHGTGTCAPFGAAAAAARAFGLDAGRTAAALALAGEAASGYRQYQIDGSLLDTALNAARGAELGVAAAEMAAAGLAGPPGILDGRWGLVRLIGSGDPAALTAGLGEAWEFRASVIKPYASCRFTHGPVQVLRDAGLDPAGVTAVEIATFLTSCEVSDRPEPRTPADAVLSHQVAAALALLGRPILPETYLALDEAVRALAAKVRVRHDPALDAAYPARWPHRVTVDLADGSRRVLMSDQPPAATGEAVGEKFLGLASPVLGRRRAAAIMAATAALERLAEAGGLASLFAPACEQAA